MNFSYLITSAAFISFTSLISAQKSGSNSPRIIGGTEAPKGAYPWMVSLVDADKTSNFAGHFCGGVLIHPHWIMTAAHCVTDALPSEVDVVIGATNLQTDTGSTVSRVNVIDIIKHPLYDNISRGYDVALLLLETPQTTRATIELLRNDATNNALANPGQTARALGWGDTSTPSNPSSGFPPQLLQVDLPLVASTVPTASNYNALTAFTENRLLFAGRASGGIDTSPGDSGGPLLVRANTASPWQVAGITSFGPEIPPGNPGAYGAYTDVRLIRDWVRSIIESDYVRFERLYGNSQLPRNADADNDGLTNWQEFALAQNPLSPQPIRPQAITANTTLNTFTFWRPSIAPEVSYTIEKAANGLTTADWTIPTNPALTFTTGTGANFHFENVTYTDSTAPSSSLFYRIRVTRNTAAYAGTQRDLFINDGLRDFFHILDQVSTAPVRYSRDYHLRNLPTTQPVFVYLTSDTINVAAAVINANTGATVLTLNNSISHPNDERGNFTPVLNTTYIIRVTSTQPGAFTLAAHQSFVSQNISPSNTTTTSATLATSNTPLPEITGANYYARRYNLTNLMSNRAYRFEAKTTVTTFSPETKVRSLLTGEAVFGVNQNHSDNYYSTVFLGRSNFSFEGILSSINEFQTGNATLKLTELPNLLFNQSAINGSLTTDSPFVNLESGIYFYQDYLLVNLPANRTTINVNTTSALYVPSAEIYDLTTGELVKSNFNDNLSGGSTTLEAKIKPGRTYLVRMISFNPGFTGNFTIRAF